VGDPGRLNTPSPRWTRSSAVVAALRGLVAESNCRAPHLIDDEAGNVLRVAVLCGEMGEQTTRTGLRTLGRHDRPPVTADVRLSKAPDLSCKVELVA
jgi:hypothetical protein